LDNDVPNIVVATFRQDVPFKSKNVQVLAVEGEKDKKKNERCWMNEEQKSGPRVAKKNEENSPRHLAHKKME